MGQEQNSDQTKWYNKKKLGLKLWVLLTIIALVLVIGLGCVYVYLNNKKKRIQRAKNDDTNHNDRFQEETNNPDNI